MTSCRTSVSPRYETGPGPPARTASRCNKGTPPSSVFTNPIQPYPIRSYKRLRNVSTWHRPSRASRYPWEIPPKNATTLVFCHQRESTSLVSINSTTPSKRNGCDRSMPLGTNQPASLRFRGAKGADICTLKAAGGADLLNLVHKVKARPIVP